MAGQVLDFKPPDSPQPEQRSRLGNLLPGIVAGAADLDPAAVLTATVAGAVFGYSVAWVVLAAIPVLWSVFSVSSRIGGASRKGLIELVRQRFGNLRARLLAAAVCVVNFMMIIGDLVAVSDALSIITHQSRLYFLAPLAFVVWYMLIIGDARKSMERLGALALALLAYIAAAVLASPPAPDLAKAVFIPDIQGTAAYAMAVVAVFGSLLTPDVIVWQTSSKRDVPHGMQQGLHSESHAGTFVATAVSISAIICAARLHTPDPSALTFRSAAEALNSLGELGPLLFAMGIIGSGLVALPLLAASLSFSIAEAAGWQSGLSKMPWEARHFYVIISSVLVVGVLIALIGVNTVSLLYWSQVMAGVLIVPILWLLKQLGNDPDVVPRPNGRFDNWCLTGALSVTIAANFLLLWSSLAG